MAKAAFVRLPVWLVALWLGLTGPAQASLGQRAASVEADRVHLSARMASTAATTHTVQTLTLANGGIVREYLDPDGVVFAVSWRSPGRPDLRQLLGAKFETLQADAVHLGTPRTRRPLAVNRSGLIIHSGGHPGAFWGLGYLPQRIPAGFTASDLQLR